MFSFLEKDKVNQGRQLELDIARGLAVLFMIAVHVLEAFSTESVIYSTGGLLVELLGGPPAAPVFMFLLGAGILYSKKSDPRVLFLRGIKIFALGYLLNFLRGSLPYFIGFFVTKDESLLPKAMEQFLAVDILQFAGLCLITFSFLVRFIKDKRLWALFSLIILGVNFILLNIKVEPLWLQAISALFWGSGELSYFPLFSWIIYPMAGYFFASLLIRCKDKKIFYTSGLLIGFFTMAISAFLFAYLWKIDIGLENQYNYYHQTLFGNIIFLFFVIFWISLIYFTSRFMVGFSRKTLQRWSGNVTSIYFIHWIIIGFLSIFIHANSQGYIYSLAIFVLLTLVSDWLAWRYGKAIRAKR